MEMGPLALSVRCQWNVADRGISPGHQTQYFLIRANRSRGCRHPGGADHTPGHPGTDGRDGCDGVPDEGFTKKLRHVPALLRKTLTYDRGKEMAEHERLAQRLAIQSVLCRSVQPLATRHQ